MAPDTLFGPTLIRREAHKWWWAFLVGAVAWFIIAWLVLRANYTSLATVGVLVGVLFLIAAVNEGTLGRLSHGGWAFVHWALCVLFVLGAVWSFVRPVNTFFALASILGLLLFLQGVTTIIRAVAMREESSYWWLELIAGILITALAIWVSTSDRAWGLAERGYFILIFVGFMAIFRGISDIFMAFTLRKLGSQDVPPQPRRSSMETTPTTA